MPLPPQASHIHLSPSTTPQHPPSQPRRIYIIYFITGNPGLIEYYRLFLTHLFSLLTTPPTPSSSQPSSTHPIFHIYGRSLSGFETHTASSTTPAKFSSSSPPYTLKEQILHSEAALEEIVEKIRLQEASADIRVILAGHSVGAYMALEIVRRQRAKHAKDAVRIAGAICLFPTVTHILKSDSGRKFGPLLTLPPVPRLTALLTSLLTSILPLPLLTLLVHRTTGFPPPALHTTLAFLSSAHGVHQALYMAASEMRGIGPDMWTDEVWGAAQPSPHVHARPVLRFLFASRDHWVGSVERDELVRARGVLVGGEGGREEGDGEDWKPRMEIDVTEGWVHGFCCWEGMSVGVAAKVNQYVWEIVRKDMETDSG